jgi:hypothetical protein
MKKLLSVCFAIVLMLGIVTVSNAVVIDFTGGTAYLNGGGTATPTNDGIYWSDVDYYIEDGIKIDFVGGSGGVIGNYYGGYTGKSSENNSVIHAHWDSLASVVFSKVDGSTFDMNYMDLTSNTTNGGFSATGAELSYVTTNNGVSMLLPSSDWGINFLSDGMTPGDGIQRLWMSAAFDGIYSFTVTSRNAYCFGLDNFYIDEPPPPPLPEPTTMLLLGLGLMGLAGVKRRFKE